MYWVPPTYMDGTSWSGLHWEKTITASWSKTSLSRWARTCWREIVCLSPAPNAAHPRGTSSASSSDRS
jgi:hypothetical protein